MDYNLEDEDFQIWVLTIALAIVVLPIIFYLAAGESIIDLFSVITTSLLSLALVVLYFQQATLLDKQTELMHRDYQSALSKRGRLVADEDEITVELKNTGRGKVRRVYLKSEIVSDTGDLDVAFGRVPMKNVENDSRELQPDSDFERFSGRVTFRILSSESLDEERGLPFKMVSRMLSEEGFSSCTLKLTLEILDEGIIEEEFSYEIEVAEQELHFKEPRELESEGEIPQATSVEEGIESMWSSTQDINQKSLEEIDHVET